MYEYTATVIRVVDGDTLHANVDLGCDVHIGMTIRLARINAPEMSVPEGKLAKDALESLLFFTEGTFPYPIVLHTVKDSHEKYGRYLGDLVINGRNVNDAMVSGGHAVYVKYK